MHSYTEEHIYQVAVHPEDRSRIENLQESLEYDDCLYSIVYQWCEETFGEELDGRWYHMYMEAYDSDMYCFKNEEDRSWFLMRWS